MIGERMKSLREQHGLSQAALANAIGIAQSSIGNYERGSRIPDSETIIALAKFFDVTSDYLLGLSNDPTKIPSAVNELGLSYEAVDRLIEWNAKYPHGKEGLFSLSILILYPDFFDILNNISMLIDSTVGEKKNSIIRKYTREDVENLSLLSEKASEMGYCLVEDSLMPMYLKSAINKKFQDVIQEICNFTANTTAHTAGKKYILGKRQPKETENPTDETDK